MSSGRAHSVSRENRSQRSNSSSRRNGSTPSNRSKSRQGNSREKRQSADNDGNQQVSDRISPNGDRNSSKPQVTKYDTCTSGNDIYTSVLGPTPDETLLVGLKTFLGFCTTHSVAELPNYTSQSTLDISNNNDDSTESHDSVQEIYAISEDRATLPLLEEESEIENISEAQFLGEPDPAPEIVEPQLQIQQTQPSESEDIKPEERKDIIPTETREEILSDNNVVKEDEKETPSKSEESLKVYSDKQTSTSTIEIKTESIPTVDKEVQTDQEVVTKKPPLTSESTISSSVMSKSEHSTSQTENPSQESRTSQTSEEIRPKQKKTCFCTGVDDSVSAPNLKSRCNCISCSCKRKTKIKKRRCRTTCSASSKTRSRCACSSPSAPTTKRCCCCCSSTDISYSTEEEENIAMRNGQRGVVKYAITKITKFCSYTTFEILKSTRKKPKVMPTVVEGVFVLKNTKDT